MAVPLAEHKKRPAATQLVVMNDQPFDEFFKDHKDNGKEFLEGAGWQLSTKNIQPTTDYRALT